MFVLRYGTGCSLAASESNFSIEISADRHVVCDPPCAYVCAYVKHVFTGDNSDISTSINRRRTKHFCSTCAHVCVVGVLTSVMLVVVLVSWRKPGLTDDAVFGDVFGIFGSRELISTSLT